MFTSFSGGVTSGEENVSKIRYFEGYWRNTMCKRMEAAGVTVVRQCQGRDIWLPLGHSFS